MPSSKITPTPKHCVLLLAGLLSGVPTAASAAPGPAQDRSNSAAYQNANSHAVTVIADGADSRSNTYLHLAKVLVLKNETGEETGISDILRQRVAPRLQSRIRKNPEFAAFVKLVQATSEKQYSPEEMFKLYLSYKEWSQKTGAQNQ